MILIWSESDHAKTELMSVWIKIVLGIQDLMNDPNNADPAQLDAFSLYKSNRAAYDAKIKEQAKSMAA
ncbi:E2 SUMO-conjugating protein ubc9 [Puccinia graminis f. sp. tritici]|uniref:E2 SUMO-conjugating protein ubc9 n=1 Tax=Puccinia graminis f. sp. tritici TaxID=56615 RepID=A0A5B0S0E5_PUCGR|nr:E2 SUMO-conjugating protein ubc9 [Puccinia graminis f. sp. tritici]